MRSSLLLICIFCFITFGRAQQFYMPQGQTYNTSPFGSNYGNKVQWLYHPSDFVIAPIAGDITKIYFKVANNSPNTTATLNNFSIRMANTTLDTFINPTFVTPTTLVFSGNPTVIPATAQNTWFSFTLQTPFTYTGQNIIVEIQQDLLVAGGIWESITAVGGMPSSSLGRRIWGMYNWVTGYSKDNYLADLGFDICSSCDSPVNIAISALSAHNANIKWGPVPCATGYEYLIDQNPGNPTGTGYPVASNPAVSLSGLQDSTCYYIHIKTHCAGAYNLSGWSVDSFCTLTADTSTSVATINNSAISVLAYPNPVKEQINIEIAGETGSSPTLRLTDITGKVLATQPAKGRKTIFKTGNLAPGLYYIEYSDDQYKRLIKINKQ